MYVPEIKKTGSYDDPVNGRVTWTIEYTHGKGLDDSGKRTCTPVYLTDVFDISSQVFVGGSLRVDGEYATIAEPVDESFNNISSLEEGQYTYGIVKENEVDTNIQQLIYMLPEDLAQGATLTITYQTSLTSTTLDKIMSYDGETPVDVENKAQIYDDLGKEPIAFDSATVDVTGEETRWIHKFGKYVEYDDHTGGYIVWTLNVNVFDNSMSYLGLYDLIGAGQKLYTGPDEEYLIKIYDTVAEEYVDDDCILYLKETDETDATGIVDEDAGGSYSFKIKFPENLTVGQYTITYRTDVAAGIYENGEDTDLGNTAWLKYGWPDSTGPIPGLDTIIPPTVELPINIAANSLEKEGIYYDKVNHTITWEITINPHRIDFYSGTLTDVLCSCTHLADGQCDPGKCNYGQHYIGGSFRITEVNSRELTSENISSADLAILNELAALVNVSSTNTKDVQYEELKVAIGRIGDNSVTFRFETVVNDMSMWSDNQATEFVNWATLKAQIIAAGADESQRSTVELSVEGTVAANIDVLKKDSDGYDYVDQSITWQVTVNADKIPMELAIIDDVLPVGLSYVTNSVEVKVLNGEPGAEDREQIDPEVPIAYTVNYTDSTRKLNINLGKNADKQTLVVTYKTKVHSDDVGAFWTISGDESVEFENNVTLTRDGGYTTNPIVETVPINGPVVSKDGNLVAEKGKVEYTIELNPNKLNMQNPKGVALNTAVITDYLPDGMLINLSSVHLYIAGINSDGTLYYINPDDPTNPDGSTKTNQEVDIRDTLVYDINNDDTSVPLGQYFQITLAGTLADAGISAAPYISNLSEYLTQQRYILTYDSYLFTDATNTYKNVVKIDGHDELPAEAESSIKVYKASGSIRAVKFSTSYRVEITKIDEARPGIKLEGVTFELYEVFGKTDSYGGDELLRYTEKTNSDGVALFGGLVEGKTYRIYETVSKDGYPLSNNVDFINDGNFVYGKRLVREITVGTGGYNAGDILKVEYPNEPNRGSFSFKKVLEETNGSRSNAVTDAAKFSATDMGYKSNVYYASVVNDGGEGIVTFDGTNGEGLPFGIYLIEEIDTPTYYDSASSFYAVIHKDGVFVGFYEDYDDAVAAAAAVNAAAVSSENQMPTDDNDRCTVINKRKTINLTLTKTDTSRNASIYSPTYINGVTFRIYKSGTDLGLAANTTLSVFEESYGALSYEEKTTPSATGTITTSNTGRATFTGLEQGYHYYVFETSAPAGYNNTANSKVGTLVYVYSPTNEDTGKAVVPDSITNTPKLGGFSFYKYGTEAAVSEPYPMPGVSFTATDYTKRYPGTTSITRSGYSKTVNSNASGEVIFDNMPFGVYRITETNGTVSSVPTFYDGVDPFFAVIGADGNPKGFYTTETAAVAALEAGTTYLGASGSYRAINTRKSFSLRFYKYDSRESENDNYPVSIQSPATFALYRTTSPQSSPPAQPAQNGVSFTDNGIIYTYIGTTTSVNGLVSFTYNAASATYKYLEQGYYYYLYEMTVPEGYEDQIGYVATINTNTITTWNNNYLYTYGSDSDTRITNDPITTGDIEFTKYGELHGRQVILPGAEFTARDQTTYSGVVSEPITSRSVDGKVIFENLPFGIYEIRETSTPAYYKSHESFYAKIDENGNLVGFSTSTSDFGGETDGTYPVTNERKEFGLYITKQDSMRHSKISGVTFKLYKSLEVEDAPSYSNLPDDDFEPCEDEKTTIADGIVTFTSLKQGYYYYLYEIYAPEGYTEGESYFEKCVLKITPEECIDWVDKHTYEVTIPNDPNAGEFIFTKVDEYGDPMSVTFIAYDQISDGLDPISRDSDGNGLVKFETLPFGVYKIVEEDMDYYEPLAFYIKINDNSSFGGYSLDGEDFSPDINTVIDDTYSEENMLYITNKRKTFSLTFKKTDSITGEPIDVTFQINRKKLDGSEISVGEVSTGAYGEVTYEPFDLYQGYEYSIYESGTPDGYTDNIDGESIATFLADEDNYDFEVTNYPNTGGFGFKKVDDNGEVMQNITFTATDLTRDVEPEIRKSNGNGWVTFDELPFGVYMITEEELEFYEPLPPFYAKVNEDKSFEGYSSSATEGFTRDNGIVVSSDVLNDDVSDVSSAVIYNDALTVTNKRKTFSLTLTKIDSSAGNLIEDVEFTLYRATSEGKEIPEGGLGKEIFDKKKTNEDGVAEFSDKLYQGYWYFLYETDAPSGYEDNIEEGEGTFIASFFAEEDDDGYEFEMIEGNTIENDPNLGSFTFKKVGENDTEMANIWFTATDQTRTGANQVREISNGDGVVTFENLPFGTYMIEEDAQNYYENLPPFYVEITPEGVLGDYVSSDIDSDEEDSWLKEDESGLTDFVVSNKRMTFILPLTKIDRSTGLTLDGVLFKLFRAEPGNASSLEPVGEKYTSDGGKVVFDSPEMYQGYSYFLYEYDTLSGYGNDIIDKDGGKLIASFFAGEKFDGDEKVDRYEFVLDETESIYADNTIVNDPNTGTFSFKKVDEFDELYNVKFIATDQTEERYDTYKSPREATSDRDGIVVFEDLPFGIYKVEEIERLEYYKELEPFYVKIDENGNFARVYRLVETEEGIIEDDYIPFITSDDDGTMVVNNMHQPYVLSIVKKDSREGDVTVKGITFAVYSGEEDGERIDIPSGSTANPEELGLVYMDSDEYATNNTGITNDVGRVTFSGLLGGRWYYVYEKPTQGYTGTDFNFKFIASGFADDDQTDIEFDYIELDGIERYSGYTNFINNTPNEGMFSFTKVDENGSAMEGIEFTATDTTTGSEVERTAVSKADGKVEFKKLPFGVYEIVETTPAYYRPLVFYVRINEEGSFGGFYSTKPDAESGNIDKRWATQNGGNIYNERKTAQLTITKKDIVRNTLIPGVTFELYEEGISTPVAVEETNNDGKVTFDTLKQGVAYEVVEITPDGYKPLADPVVLRITPEDKIDGYAGYTHEVENEPAVAIQFKTVTDSGDLLPGVEFRMRKLTSDGEEAEEWIAISDESGIVTFYDVPSGRYRIRNTLVPDRYDIKETVFYAEVRWDPELMRMFAGLINEDGTFVEGNTLVYGYTDPGSNSGSNSNSGTGSSSKQAPVSSLNDLLPQTGQNRILVIALLIVGVILAAAGGYIYWKRRDQKNEK